MSDEVSEATVNENHKLETQEEQITKPAPKVKPQREKDPKKVAAGKKLAEKNRQAKAALEREIKREIAEKEKENENSAGWLPEMSFQTVLSIVGVAFSAFELYKRFHQKKVLEVPKVRFLLSQNQNRATAKPERSSERRPAKWSKDLSSRKPSADESRACWRNRREAPSVQKSEWPKLIYFFLPLKCQNKIN